MKRLKVLNPQKRVPIPEAPSAEPLDYDYLLQLERDGFDELPVKDGNRLVKVNVRKLLKWHRKRDLAKRNYIQRNKHLCCRRCQRKQYCCRQRKHHRYY